jgi:hypothetical protein
MTFYLRPAMLCSMLGHLWMVSLDPFATYSPTEQASWDASQPWLGVLGSHVFFSEMLGM